MRDWISGVLRQLRVRSAPRPGPAEPDKHQRDLQALHARVDRLSTQIAKMSETLRARDAQLTQQRAIIARRRRTTLRPAVLRDVLQLRAEHLPLLAEERAAARARELTLLEASSPYRVTSGDEATRQASLTRTMVEGVPWWIPSEGRGAEQVARSAAQGFPFKAILQTRELALGGVMLDLGANIGRTSIPRLLMGDVRAVYCAEADPVNYACLVQNVIEHNLRGLVLPDHLAIGAVAGTVQLKRSKYIGGHRVMSAAEADEHLRLRGESGAPHDSRTVTVPALPLDEWMTRVRIERDAVTFVKVDTQGSEVNVLRGASGLLARRHVTWFIEVDPTLLAAAGFGVRDLVTLIEAHFTHFIDVGNADPGPRVQSTRVLGEALAYVGRRQVKTDLLVYCGPTPH